MIAITFALPAESLGILRKLKSKRVADMENARIFHGKISGCEVAIFHTGIGRERCRHNIEKFLHAVEPKILISSGFAGSLTQDLEVGDLMVAKNFSDTDLMARTLESGLTLHNATLLTVASMVDSIEDRKRLARENSADAIDMETDVIAKSCAAHGVRMLSLRVISDSTEAPFPAPPRVLFDIGRQKTEFGKLLFYIVRNPAAIGRLIRFAGQIAKARNALTTTIPQVLERL
jgi:nucleoside phosphorylase